MIRFAPPIFREVKLTLITPSVPSPEASLIFFLISFAVFRAITKVFQIFIVNEAINFHI